MGEVGGDVGEGPKASDKGVERDGESVEGVEMGAEVVKCVEESIDIVSTRPGDGVLGDDGWDVLSDAPGGGNTLRISFSPAD